MSMTNKGNKKTMNSKPVKYVTVAALPFKGLDKAGIVFSYDPITKVAILPDGSKVDGLVVTDKNYFKEANYKFDSGTVVIHTSGGNTRLYIVDKVDFITGCCTLRDYYTNVYKYNVSQQYMAIAEVYWFINSEGCICETYIGKKERADKWRKLSGNMFTSKEEAQAKYHSIMD